jgi:uncharacterized protein (DUF1778 family)
VVAAKEQKTAVLSVRIKPSVKAMVEKLAEADGRSLASFVERLIEAANAAGTEIKKPKKP